LRLKFNRKERKEKSQGTQADTQSKACQRVRLSHAEKKELKIPFPSEILKTPTPKPT